jgi:2-hydroxychromene-2-carboxylate isomerase
MTGGNRGRTPDTATNGEDMPSTLEFYFDFGSPNAYIAHVRLPAILARAGARVEPKIMLLGGVFQATGNVSPAAVKFKISYTRRDMLRFVDKYQVPFAMNPHFPVNTLKLMRGAVVAEEGGFLAAYMDAAFGGMWRDGLDMADEAVFAGALDRGGLDAAHVMRRIAEDGVKDKLKAYTAAAVARGIFGAPTFFVGDEMFFGQDRLEFVEDALLGRSYLRDPPPA